MICGSGSEAHAFAGIASSVKGTEVRVLSLYQDEAERWSAAMQKSDLEVTLHRKGKEPTSIKSKPALVTKNPEDAMRDVDIVVFVLPAFAHELYLDAIKPYIKPGTIVVGLPGGPGFQFQVREVLGDVARKCAIVNFESSPWVCRITEFGVKCEVLGTKETLQGAMKVRISRLKIIFIPTILMWYNYCSVQVVFVSWAMFFVFKLCNRVSRRLQLVFGRCSNLYFFVLSLVLV